MWCNKNYQKKNNNSYPHSLVGLFRDNGTNQTETNISNATEHVLASQLAGGGPASYLVITKVYKLGSEEVNDHCSYI